MLAKLKCWILYCVKLSFYAHHGQFDVIQPVNGSYSIESVRKCWSISLGLYILAVLYGSFGLEYESRPLGSIDWASVHSSQYNYLHQMFPRAIWREIYFMAFSVAVLCAGSWITFLVNPQIEKRFLVLLVGKYQKDELEQMATFQRRYLKLAFVMEIALFVGGCVFAYVHVLYINANYNVNLTSLLFWLVLNPIHVYYDVVFLYSVPLYVILASRYITIQQETLKNKLVDLNQELSKIRQPNVALRRDTLQRHWLQYLYVNGQICDLCAHVREYARFWSPFLTLLFATFIAFQCYVFYMFLFVTELPAALRLILMFVVLGVVFNELLLINECAAVVKQFRLITVQNREFYIRYRNVVGVGKILKRNLLKAENLQDSRLLHSYAFRLFGNYRITTKSFHIIISYISLFFLYIVKNNDRSRRVIKYP